MPALAFCRRLELPFWVFIRRLALEPPFSLLFRNSTSYFAASCKIDGQECDSLWKMRVNFIWNHDENLPSPFTSPQWLLAYSNRGNLNKHVSTVLKSAIPWDEWSDANTRNLLPFLTDTKIHVKLNRHECKECCASFQFPDGLQRHIHIAYVLSWNTLSSKWPNQSGDYKTLNFFFLLFCRAVSVNLSAIFCCANPAMKCHLSEQYNATHVLFYLHS